MNILNFFDREREKLVRQTERLQNALHHLRYEGKPSRGKNLKAISRIMEEIDADMKLHKILQEKAVFSLLKVYIPRFESAIHMLETEHEEITQNSKTLKTFLKKCVKNTNGWLENGKIYETGIYQISLLRHHIGFENKSIHKAVKTELREAERREVGRKIAKWLNKHCARIS